MGSFIKCPICTKSAPCQLDLLALNLALLDIVSQVCAAETGIFWVQEIICNIKFVIQQYV